MNSSEVKILNVITTMFLTLMFDGLYVLDSAIKLKAINHGLESTQINTMNITK